jgi:hypothetical protein
LTVTFTPTQLGAASADLTVTSTDAAEPSRTVSLAGRAVAKVQNLQAVAVGSEIHLSWNPFSTGGPAFGHFNVYRSTQPIPGNVAGLAPIDQSLTDVGATSFLDTEVESGVSYFFAVTPVLADGSEFTEVDPAGPVAFFDNFGPLAPELQVAGAATDEDRPAVAFNPAAQQYLVVYERRTGAPGNLDVYGQRIAANGALVGGSFAIAGSVRDERRPRLAFNLATNRFLVVYELDWNGDGSNYVVMGQMVNANATLSGSPIIVGGFVVDELVPEVAYNATANEFFVVFEFDSDGDGGNIDVAARRVSAAGAIVGDAFYVGRITVNGVHVHDRAPHLAWNSAANEYLIVYEVDLFDDGSDIDVLGVRLPATSMSAIGPFFVASSAVGGEGRHDLNPYVAYDGAHNQVLATWELDFSGDGTDFDVWSQKIAANGTATGLLDGFVGLATSPESELRPRQAYNAGTDEFLVTWDVGELAIDARRFQVTSNRLLLGEQVEVASSTSTRHRPDLALNAPANESLVVWAGLDPGAGTGSDVFARRLGNQTPQLQITPASLSFGTALTQQSLTVTNAGNGTLEWFISTDVPWVEVSPASGTTTTAETVQVTVEREGLAAGDYGTALHFFSSGGNGDVPLTLSVANHPPSAPGSPSPADGATGQAALDGTLNLTLLWQAADPDGDALAFDVYLGTDQAQVDAQAPGVRVATGIAQVSLPATGLSASTTYYWKIVAQDPPGARTPGPTWTFATAAVPAPILIPEQPDPTRESRPTLAWQSVAGAASYRIQVAVSAGFSPPLHDVSALAGTSFTPASDLPEGSIFWRVASADGSGNAGPFSAPDTFAIDRTPPAPPTLVPVAPDPGNDPQPLLAWSGPGDASSFHLQVASSPGFASPVVDLLVAAASFQPTQPLPEGTLFWRLRSLDPAGNESAFSAAGSFTLDLTAPPPIAGLTAERIAAGVALAWTAVAGPPADFAHYSLYRDSAPIVNTTGLTPLESSLTDPAATSFIDTTAAPGSAYHYAVAAADQVGNENHGVTSVAVPVNQAPTAPASPSPADGATGQGGADGFPPVGLSWQASDPEGAPLAFDVYLSTEIALVESLDLGTRVAEGLALSTFTTAPLAYETTYHWRVLAVDDLGAAAAGPVWSFTTRAIAAPQLLPVVPDPTQEPRPAFSWQEVAGAGTYRFQLDDEATFGAPLLDVSGLASTSFTPAADLPEGLLHWRVAAVDTAGHAGAFSAPDSFEIDRTPLPQIEGLAVARVGDAFVLTWTALVSPPGELDHFNVYRAPAAFSDVTGMTPIDSSLTDPAATSFTDATPDPAQGYHYAVTAVDHAGNEDPAVASAATPNQAPAFTWVAPGAGGGQADTAYTLSWSDDDPDDDAQISLFYDGDAAGADGTLIAGGIAEDADGAGDQWAWNTSAVTSGDYYVYAVVADGTNPPLVVYSAGTVRIRHAGEEIFSDGFESGDFSGWDQVVE